MFYTCGVSGCPHICIPPYVNMPPYIHTPPGVYMPPYSSMPLFLEALHAVGGCNGFHFVLGHPPLHHPCLGVPPPHYTPHSVIGFPGHWYVSGILVCYVGISLLSGRVWACFPISWGVGGHQHLGCPYAHSCTFL